MRETQSINYKEHFRSYLLIKNQKTPHLSEEEGNDRKRSVPEIVHQNCFRWNLAFRKTVVVFIPKTDAELHAYKHVSTNQNHSTSVRSGKEF